MAVTKRHLQHQILEVNFTLEMFFPVLALLLGTGYVQARSCPIGTYDYSSLLLNNCTQFDDTSQTTVTLSGVGLSSLHALSSLSFTDSLAQWRGMLSVSDTTQLVSLDGLQGLVVSSGTLVIQGNAGLLSLYGLDRLVQSNGELTVVNNPMLTLVNLSSLALVNTLTLSQLPIPSLLGLGTIQSIIGDFRLDSCPYLSTLQGLSASLTSINGEFRLSNLSTLFSLQGLESLTAVGTLTISSCLSFQSLQGLALSQCSALTLSNNPSLTTITFPSSLTHIDGSFLITSNPLLVTLSVPLTQIGDLSIVNQSSITYLSLPFLTTINGALHLENVGVATLLGCSSLLSLSSLTCIQTALTTLNGLQGVTVLSAVTLQHNANLTTLNGLNHLTTLGALVLDSNPLLLDVSAWSSWTSLPSSHQLTQTCCPSYAMLALQPLVTVTWWSPCLDCVRVTSLSPSVVPSTGGSHVQFTYDGNIERSIVNVSFTNGQTYVPCNVSLSTINCRVDDLSSGDGFTLPLLSIVDSRPLLPIAWYLVYFDPLSYFQLSSWSWTDYPPASVQSQTPFAGQLSSRTNPATTIATWLIGSVLIVLFILSVLLALGNRWCGWCHRSSIRRCDCIYIYNEEHEQHQKQGKLLYRKQTVVGGVATLWIVIIIASVVSGYLITILMDGSTSSIVLQPTQINNAFVNSYTSFLTVLALGNSSCTDITTSLSGLSPTPQVIQTSDCTWSWSCDSCTLTAGSWSIQSMSENVFHHGYVWNFSSIDYFGSIQAVDGVIRPTLATSVFQGSRPTLIDLTVNPSIYQAYDNDPLYGTQLSLNTQSNGSVVTPATYGDEAGFAFLLTFTPFSSTTAVLVTQKEDLLTILSKMVSIVFGVFSIASYSLNLIYRIKYWVNRSKTTRSPRAGVELPTP